MTKIKVKKISEDHFRSINTSICDKLKINNIQSYFPILSIYFNYYNNEYSKNLFTLDNKYI